MPMFRHERPQAGRYREFVQFGVEFFGEANYLLDADVICLMDLILKSVCFEGKYKVVVNTIGDFESRTAYQTALKEREERDKLAEEQAMKDLEGLLDCGVSQGIWVDYDEYDEYDEDDEDLPLPY